MSGISAAVREQIGQMFLVGFEGLTPPDYLLRWLAEGRAGGVILFARNVESPSQLAALTQAIHAAARKPALIAIDQEGGTVARLRQGFTESPGAMALAAAWDGGDQTAREGRVRRVSGVLGTEMRALGINWTFAPVLDILYTLDNPSLLTRSFGADAESVSALAAAAVTGFQAAGVAACGKHFPGLGNTAIDTHMALPVLDTPVPSLLKRDLAPYRAAVRAGLAAVMTTHTIFSALDQTYPATLSPVVVRQLLRDALGFEGVVTTDCMEMKAISDHFGPAESAALAALAGVDIILISHTPAVQEAAFEGLCSAVESGRVSEEVIVTAAGRIAALKARFPTSVAPDLSVIRCASHLDVVREAARAGTVRYAGKLPFPIAGRGALVEFASFLESGIVERGGQTGLIRLAEERLPGTATFAVKGEGFAPDEQSKLDGLLREIEGADALILATRNAHLQPGQLALARSLLARAKRAALLCLRSPRDAAVLPGTQVTLCTCGDSTPSLEAALDALTGQFVPGGRLPFKEMPA